MTGDVFQVTMLDVLRAPFERWLAGRGLAVAGIPDSADPAWIVVPAECPGVDRDSLVDVAPDLPDPWPAMLRFLWVQIAEDGLLAMDLDAEQWQASPSGDPMARHLVRYSPARAEHTATQVGMLVADAATALHIAAVNPGDTVAQAVAEAQRLVLRRLAAMYAAHPDYRQEWAA